MDWVYDKSEDRHCFGTQFFVVENGITPTSATAYRLIGRTWTPFFWGDNLASAKKACA